MRRRGGYINLLAAEVLGWGMGEGGSEWGRGGKGGMGGGVH